jgi:tetratricopeptide (TPR) repeat protein
MRKIAILSMMCIAIGITSCKKYLDIKPQQTFGSNLAVTSVQGLQQTTVGAFSQIQSGNLYGGGIIANSELMADFINPNTPILTSFSYSQEYTHQLNIYNSNSSGMWGSGYQAILTANTVLEYLPNFQAQDPADCNLMKGECLFIRAAMHFELVRMFAQPWGFTSGNTARSTVAQVYAQVIADLLAAEPLLPADVNAIGPDYVSKYGAEAMLARVYFEQNDYTDAQIYATKVISAGFSLNTSLLEVYNVLGAATTPETIFQSINTAKNDPANGTLHDNFTAAPFGSTVPNFAMNTPLVSLITAGIAVGDQRAIKLFKTSFGKYYCIKDSAQYSNVPVIRLAEMYLTRAECEAQQGDDADARADYNKTRVRAGLVADNSSTGQGLIAAIRSERDLELAMEGDHYFEVKRRQGIFNTPGAGPLAWNAFNMIYPIPQQEVQENKLMVQNPGY